MREREAQKWRRHITIIHIIIYMLYIYERNTFLFIIIIIIYLPPMPLLPYARGHILRRFIFITLSYAFTPTLPSLSRHHLFTIYITDDLLTSFSTRLRHFHHYFLFRYGCFAMLISLPMMITFVAY